MVGGQASGRPRAAFYDFDGTLASGNVVSRYAWVARQHPSRLEAAWRYSEALLGVPLWLLLDLCSRHLFNVVFFRLYRGLSRDWLKAQSTRLLEQRVRREECRYARERVAMDRAAGFRTVLVTGGIDILLAPTAADLGFDDMLGNRLVFRDGIADWGDRAASAGRRGQGRCAARVRGRSRPGHACRPRLLRQLLRSAYAPGGGNGHCHQPGPTAETLRPL